MIRLKEEESLVGECSKMATRHAGRFKCVSASSTRLGGSPAPPLPTPSERYYGEDSCIHHDMNGAKITALKLH